MDRNTIIGLLLIVGILVGYGIISRPSQEELERMQHQRDSVAQVNRIEQERLAEELRKAETQKSLPTLDSTATDSTQQQQMREMFGTFSDVAVGKNRFITMENNLMKVTFSTKGGRPYSAELKNYKRFDRKPLVLFNGDSTIFGFNFFAQNYRIATNDLYFEPSAEQFSITADGDSTVLLMRLNTGDAQIEYRYTMRADDYMVGFDVRLVNMNRLIASNQTSIDFDWQTYSPRQEKGAENENTYTSLFYRYYRDDVEELSASQETDEKKIPTRLDWIAFKQQFFSWGLVAKESFSHAELKSQKIADQQRYIKKYEAVIGIEFNNRQPEQTIAMNLYFGPNHYKTLKKYGVGMEQLVPLGANIIRWINRFVIIQLFDWLGSFISNYGLIILLLTIIIKIGLLPLTFKSFMSSAKMRVLKPQIDEINQRIPKEKAMERQQAVMALYRKVGVSPMGGCLPMLLQFPILFAMFRLFPASIELRQQSFLWASDLSTYDSILDLPFTIPFYGDHISLFTILMTVTTVISMRMSSGQTDTSAMPGMKMMMYIMPVMFMFFLNNYSAGLTYYYFLANLITIVQNEIFKRSIDEKKILAKLQANSTKSTKKSRFQQRLEQLQKQQQSQARARSNTGKKR
ncbi:MAG: membrane protein insertase YidC [Bacteroidales bacterium]|jgi:YidC/Oxa1 family membrane protein insertase|nr:membrane protein insertase YidC [Bacteroidales bacterium]